MKYIKIIFAAIAMVVGTIFSAVIYREGKRKGEDKMKEAHNEAIKDLAGKLYSDDLNADLRVRNKEAKFDNPKT